MGSDAAKNTIFLADYTPFGFVLHRTDLRVFLHEGYARVEADIELERTIGSDPDAALTLHGVDLELESLILDDCPISEGAYRFDGELLVIEDCPSGKFCLSTSVRIYPERNTALEGLYSSNGMYCTQCEAEGFRKITFYPDRPDVMSRFTTRIEADKARFPVLLANGNLVRSADLPEGRHFAEWNDPFPKPSYLFAMVAGKLSCVEDFFVTQSGRNVILRIYVEAHDVGKVDHAMASLKRAMRWDEEKYGREYDLDIFMIVAVAHFNMGAMENKGLNIFNTSCVLAHPDTTTDAGFQRVESVVAHEYFHNWSGNRVTCRDWFQLSLKEGFTVFRDQQFSADMLSASVQRIEDVNFLRAWQFAEDGGPLSHPVRPASFVEINNFYTSTVYEKGAEIVRMMHVLLGPDKFRAGTDVYFSRHDGQAVTVEDFVRALGEGGGLDLSGFMQWYRQPGTPLLKIHSDFDPGRGMCRIHLEQISPVVPGYAKPEVLPVPVKVALLGSDGREMQVMHEGLRQSEHVLLLSDAQQSFTFEAVDGRPVLSVLRDFSAPVKLEHEQTRDDQLFLLRYDSNGFNRWRIAQDLLTAELLRLAGDWSRGLHLTPDAGLLQVFAQMLPVLASEDAALAARILTLPSVQQLLDMMAAPDPDAAHVARQSMRYELARQLQEWLLSICQQPVLDYQYSADAIAGRALSNTALGLLVEKDSSHVMLALERFQRAAHMTDQAAALSILVHSGAPDGEVCLEAFAARWQHEALVMDQWFAIQATAPAIATVGRVAQLLGHADFHRDNPNRVRALVGQFANSNPVAFHAADGRGYALLAAEVERLDAINPQVASRLAGAFSSWARMSAERRGHAAAALRTLQQRKLSSDLAETIGRLLAASDEQPSAPT